MEPTDAHDVKPESKEAIVYAELDLASGNLRPVVKGDDEKTEYAEIVYTKNGEGADEEKRDDGKEVKSKPT